MTERLDPSEIYAEGGSLERGIKDVEEGRIRPLPDFDLGPACSITDETCEACQ